jgi:hypothetical protein
MDGIGAEWRKSAYSGANGGACVEAGTAAPGIAQRAVVVRDTADRDGVVLVFPRKRGRRCSPGSAPDGTEP